MLWVYWCVFNDAFRPNLSHLLESTFKVDLSFYYAQDCPLTVLSPWFWKHFRLKHFFEILLNLRYRFYSGACCQSTQSWWLFWCCVWPDLPRYKRPHMNLSLSITCHSTSLYLKQTATLHSHTHSTCIHTYSEKTWKAAADEMLMGHIFRYACSVMQIWKQLSACTCQMASFRMEIRSVMQIDPFRSAWSWQLVNKQMPNYDDCFAFNMAKQVSWVVVTSITEYLHSKIFATGVSNNVACKQNHDFTLLGGNRSQWFTMP